ncbi:hypothetical protein LVY65_07045 [Sphingomonas sp. G124]|uniref:Lipoprotein n=1 Tax=Sphingomonas cremea TaxID=2904799 RepID=A0A9X1QMW7_9SPHN|nr:hypothetical protein [Sphingomonas cremea]MCF2514818.1 hypothetical protein [Sphingomonas cremea]
MVMRIERLLIVAGVALAGTSACTPVDPGFGEALKYDMAVQTVDPDPVYPADSLQPGYHGEKGQKATERYRKGQTKPLRTESTKSGSGSGGSGGSN